MLNINKKTIVYVVCPAFNKTGGTELEHQLVSEINKLGTKAFITYYGNVIPKINPAFKKYVLLYKNINDIRDDRNNILIIPEIRIDLLNKYKNIQYCVWWMSVDNYLKRNGIMNAIKYWGMFKSCIYLLKDRINFFDPNIPNDVLHLYQSEYARRFLISRKLNNNCELSDYINQDYFKHNKQEKMKKEDRVLFNPQKGLSFTRKLIKAAPEITWYPIQGMTNEQVRELLESSKVYIDFGNHPGKDRFPREAAISGCCVITDKQGSAKNSKDVPIPDEYKFDDIDENIPKIIRKIKKCFVNYDTCKDDFKIYREKIQCEKERFSNEVKNIFSINDI